MHEIPENRQFLFSALIEQSQELQARIQEGMITLVQDAAREMGLDPEGRWVVVRGQRGWALEEAPEATPNKDE